MAAKTLFIALLASSLPFILAAPTSEFKARSESCPGTATDAPQFFTGPQGNFPAIGTWVSFDQMVSIAKDSNSKTKQYEENQLLTRILSLSSPTISKA
jgi:hypothetical protein